MTKEKRNKYARDTYALLKRLHLCIQCKAQDAYTLAGRARCYECTEKITSTLGTVAKIRINQKQIITETI